MGGGVVAYRRRLSMTQIPILSGVYATAAGDFRCAYPVNLEPVVVTTGLSKGFLRAVPGATLLVSIPGKADRGALEWNDICYRVVGDRLISVSKSGVVADLGFIAGSLPVSMDRSFDQLAIAGGENLYYWDGTTLSQVTDPDLGPVIDMLWIDGYFMTTDGESIVVTELSDPYSVDPLKYGSSEVDPDPVTGLIEVRGEVYACNRYTIENFQNIGGSGFPFTRNPGGMIQKGVVGTHAKAPFLETFGFVGSGRNESLSVYLAGPGQALSIATPEIDKILSELTVSEQAAIELEARIDASEQRLLVHLPSRTLVYYHQASKAAESAVWSIMAAGVQADEAYPLRHLALCYGRWIGGDAQGRIGFLDETVETLFGDVTGWKFETDFTFNAGRGGIIKSVELFGLPGLAPFGENPTVFMSMTFDGQTWGQERAISMGSFGERRKRVQWRPKTRFSNRVGFRFRGASTAIASWARLDAEFEGLAV